MKHDPLRKPEPLCSSQYPYLEIASLHSFCLQLGVKSLVNRPDSPQSPLPSIKLTYQQRLMKDKSTTGSPQSQAREVMDSIYAPKTPSRALPPDRVNESPISRALRIPFTVRTTGPNTEDSADPYALDIGHYHHDHSTKWTDIMTSWLFVLFSEALKGNRELLWEDISSAAYAEFEVRPHFYDLASMGRMLGFHYQLVTDHQEFGQITSEQLRSDHDSLEHDRQDMAPNPQPFLLPPPVNITPTNEDLQNRVSTVTQTNKLHTVFPSTASLPNPGMVDAAEANNNTSDVTSRGRIDDEIEPEECDMHGFTKKQLLWLKEHGPGGKFCVFENCWKDKEVRFNEEFRQNRCSHVLFLKWASTEFSSKKGAKGEKEAASTAMSNVSTYNKGISAPIPTKISRGEPPFTEGSNKSRERIEITAHTGKGTVANPSEAAGFCFGAEHDKWLRLVVPWLNDKTGKTEWKDVKRRFTRNFRLDITIEDIKRRVREVMGERQGGWSSI